MNIFEAHHDQMVQGGEIDSRKRTNVADDFLERLANSIHQRGLLQPIVVRQPTPGGLYQIIAGNRRHAAIGLLIERGHWGKFKEIPVILRETGDAESFEDSIAENIERRQLHPVEQYEAFARAQENGATVPQLAERFGIPSRLVEQRLALGELAPVIREAMFADEIPEHAARLFCMLPDQNAQAELYGRLKAADSLGPWQIRNALSAGNAAKAFGVVSIEDYIARGGSLTEDLFGNDHIVSDPELAAAMAREVMLAECAALKDSGWSFAFLRSEVADAYSWRCLEKVATPTPGEEAELETIAKRLGVIEKLNNEIYEDEWPAKDIAEHDALDARFDALNEAIAARAVWTPDQMKLSGCFVSQEHNTGALKVEYAVVDPKSAKVAVGSHERGAPVKSAAPGVKEDDDSSASISDALAFSLSEQRTRAAAATLEEHPHIALAAAVFALGRLSGFSPATITATGIDGRVSSKQDDAPTMAQLVAMRPVALMKLFAKQVAASLDMRVQSQTSAALKHHGDLIRALPADHYEMNAKKVFDAPAYFDRVKGSVRDKALKEMDRTAPKGKKAEVVAACIDAQAAEQWLPPELRYPEDDEAGQ